MTLPPGLNGRNVSFISEDQEALTDIRETAAQNVNCTRRARLGDPSHFRRAGSDFRVARVRPSQCSRPITVQYSAEATSTSDSRSTPGLSCKKGLDYRLNNLGDASAGLSRKETCLTCIKRWEELTTLLELSDMGLCGKWSLFARLCTDGPGAPLS